MTLPVVPPSTRIAKAVRQPRNTLSGVIALLRGRWCLLKYRLLGVRVRAGRNFRVYGRLDIRGPGLVEFGDDVAIIEHAKPWTHSAEAHIRIGNDVLIGSTQFGCVREIVVGDRCQLAQAYIMDTDFHSTRSDRRSADAPVRVAPVWIGENVWVAHFAGILPGTRIGRNSVVSFGSVCTREYPENSILVGNPARVAGTVSEAPAAAVAERPPTGSTGTPLAGSSAGRS